MNIFFIAHFFLVWASIPKTYKVAVFDAGSSGTRISVYFYKSSLKGTKLLRRKLYKDSSTPSRGLHEHNDIHKIRDVIYRLIEDAGIEKNTPIGFYGTAGFRSLDPPEAIRLLDNIKNILKDFNLKEARILSGYEEGLYLGKAYVKYFRVLEKNEALVDMGGMSTQVVFHSHTGSNPYSTESLKVFSFDVGMKTIKSSTFNLGNFKLINKDSIHYVKSILKENSVKKTILFGFLNEKLFCGIRRDQIIQKIKYKDLKKEHTSTCQNMIQLTRKEHNTCMEKGSLLSIVSLFFSPKDADILEVEAIDQSKTVHDITWSLGAADHLYIRQYTSIFLENKLVN